MFKSQGHLLRHLIKICWRHFWLQIDFWNFASSRATFQQRSWLGQDLLAVMSPPPRKWQTVTKVKKYQMDINKIYVVVKAKQDRRGFMTSQPMSSLVSLSWVSSPHHCSSLLSSAFDPCPTPDHEILAKQEWMTPIKMAGTDIWGVG